MADKIDAISTPARRSWFGDFIAARPLAAIVTAIVIGVAVTAVTLFLSGLLEDSDEAPIRVKNGSLDFLLLDNSQEWEPQGNHWHVKDKSTRNDVFDLTVAPKTGASCDGDLNRIAKEIKFTYSDAAEFSLDRAGNNTKVTPSTGATLATVSGQAYHLRYGNPGEGYLQKIEVKATSGGPFQAVCTFKSAQELDSIVILNVP